MSKLFFKRYLDDDDQEEDDIWTQMSPTRGLDETDEETEDRTKDLDDFIEYTNNH